MAVAYLDQETVSPGNLALEGLDNAAASATRFAWFALQVRVRREETVADHLVGKGYELFLPLYKNRKLWSDRVKEVDAPLFPGYLFCRFDPLNRLPILKTPWVVRIVGYNHSLVPIDVAEIAAIRTLVSSGLPTQPCPYLGLGDRVRIESGPLRGMEGLLTKFKGNHRLIVSVTLLQRSVAVEIDSALVTPVHSTPSQLPQEMYEEPDPAQLVAV
jgi:transcriptional antiterminator NusG